VINLWEVIDTMPHKLKCPIPWVCDRYDLALGITRDELRQHKPR
jgi:hypothetical protein